MKTKQILMAGALALSMVLSGGMLTGCSNSSNTKDTKTTEVTKKKEVKTIGQKTKDSKSLKMTNSTGKKITVFETKSSSEESFCDFPVDLFRSLICSAQIGYFPFDYFRSWI